MEIHAGKYNEEVVKGIPIFVVSNTVYTCFTWWGALLLKVVTNEDCPR